MDPISKTTLVNTVLDNASLNDVVEFIPPKEIRVLAQILQDKRKGFFIDIGSGDGDTFNRTIYLEKYLEWKGICIEPSKDSYDLLKKNRKCSTLKLCIDKYTGNFKLPDNDGNNVDIPCYRLEDILDQQSINIIDCCIINKSTKILDILCGINFGKRRINIFIFDRTTKEEETKIEQALGRIGYRVVRKDPTFWIFIHQQPQFSFV
jgi:hypothetical protein